MSSTPFVWALRKPSLAAMRAGPHGAAPRAASEAKLPVSLSRTILGEMGPGPTIPTAVGWVKARGGRSGGGSWPLRGSPLQGTTPGRFSTRGLPVVPGRGVRFQGCQGGLGRGVTPQLDSGFGGRVSCGDDNLDPGFPLEWELAHPAAAGRDVPDEHGLQFVGHLRPKSRPTFIDRVEQVAVSRERLATFFPYVCESKAWGGGQVKHYMVLNP